MLSGCHRVLTSALQVTRFGRVDPTLKLLRLGCFSDKSLFEELCLNAAFHCVKEYAGPGAPNRLVDQFLSMHLAASGNQIAVPRWAEASREKRVVDVFLLRDEQLVSTKTALRCNAAILVHDTSAQDASDAFQHLASNVVPSLASKGIPVVLACAVEVPMHEHAARFNAKSLYGRWHDGYRALAEQHLGHIYAVHFFTPQNPQHCFDLLYRAQMASLYPLGRCLEKLGSLDPSLALREATQIIFSACDADADGLWLANDWEIFWKIVYGREPSDAETEALRSSELIGCAEGRLLQWFLHLIRQGKGDSLWTCLRAFGFDGAFCRTEALPEVSPSAEF